MMRILGILAFYAALLGIGNAQVVLEPLWSVTPDDDVPYITNSDDAFQRGLTYNSVSGNVLLASRSGGAEIRVLSATDGSSLHSLDTEDVFGGSDGFPLNLVAAAEDGAVYAANLVVTNGVLRKFTIYRWADDSSEALSTIAWIGDPAGEDDEGFSNFPDRWGDTFAVRGSGTDTQIAIAARRSGAIIIFTTTDGTTFTPTLFESGGIPNGHTSIAFGEGNTLFLKTSQAPLVRVTFALDTATLTTVSTFGGLPVAARPIGSDPSHDFLAALDTSAAFPERVQLYNTADASSDPVFLAEAPIPLENINTFATGAIAFSETTLFVLNTNNGIFAYSILDDGTINTPVIARAPSDRTTISGSEVTFSATLGGTPPFTLQWDFDDTPIPGANSNNFTLTDVTPQDSGTYTLTITNAAGSTTTSAELSVSERLENGVATPLWALPPGSRPYLAPDDTGRGLTYNPATGNLLLAARPANKNEIRVLSSVDGSEIGQLRTLFVSGGLLPLTKIQAAADGAIYACNQSLEGNDFKIYRWPSDTSTADAETIIRGSSTSFGQIGDTFRVRGTGLDTEILCTARDAPGAVIFKQDSEGFFDPYPIEIDTTEPNFGAAAEWGEGDTFWAKSEGGELHQFRYDLENGTAQVERVIPGTSFSTTMGPFSIAPGLDYIAGIAIESPDNFHVHRFSTFTLREQEFLPADNNNTELGGAVAFGGGNVYVLNTNNGLAAFSLLGRAPSLTSLDILGTSLSFEVNGETGAAYILEKSNDLQTWNLLENFTLGSPSRTFSFPLADAPTYYRVERQ